MDNPVRERAHQHQCVCLLTEEHIAGGITKTIQDKCCATVGNPDQPFCTDCENAGHPEAHNQVGKNLNLKERG